MSKRVSKTKEQTLGQRLRREALESRPEFSESLHRRIACAVRQRHAVMRAASTGPWRRRRTAALASACLLVAVTLGWQFMGSDAQQNAAGDPQTMVQTSLLIDQWTDQATTRFNELAASASLKPHTAQLKHDAWRIADTLLEPLPVDVSLVNDP